MFNICFENNLFVEFFYYKNTVFAHGKGYKLRHEIEFFNVCSRIHKVVTICCGPALTEKKLEKIEMSMNICCWGGVKVIYNLIVNYI